MKRTILVLVALLLVCFPLFSQRQKKPPRIICTVAAGKLVTLVKPTYPSEALTQGIKGPVVLELLIDKEGNPQNIKVKKGDPVLANAVIKAVKQWKYKPYKLNGEAVEVETSVTVNFEPR
jgi:periplasmic protein TonB